MQSAQRYCSARLLAVCLLLVAWPLHAALPGLSPSKSHLAAAGELLAVIDVQRMGRQMLAQYDHRVITAAKKKMSQSRHAYHPALSRYSTALLDAYAQQMGWSVTRNELVQHYAKYYSETELRRTLRYIASFGGKKNTCSGIQSC